MTEPWIYRRGAPIALSRVVDDAGAYDPADLTLTARLKLANAGGPPDASAESVASFDVAYVAAAGDVAAHWLLTIDAETSRALAPATYVVDAEISLAGTVIDVTPPVLIALRKTVTPE